MYKDYYMQARSLADTIRSGDKPERPDRKESLIKPREKEQPKTEQSSAASYQAMVAGYMAGLQKGTAEAPQPQITTRQPVASDLQAAKASLAKIESEGSGGYSALGPVMAKGSYKGDRAYGKYQVMGRNIPEWTKEALGQSMTPEEFLASPEAQEAVVDYRLSKYKQEHGTWEDAASVWFSGQPLSKARGRSDGYLTVDQYVDKFRKNLNSSVVQRRT